MGWIGDNLPRVTPSRGWVDCYLGRGGGGSKCWEGDKLQRQGLRDFMVRLRKTVTVAGTGQNRFSTQIPGRKIAYLPPDGEFWKPKQV